jgi:Fur family transcriptional regulator, ferric uptake regulator
LQVSCKYFQMDLKEILKTSNLSLTSQRIEMLNILSGCKQAISERELEALMHGSCNRTTIYRNLSSLVEKKIVHRILSGEAVKYKLVAGKKESGKKPDHVHFECTNCNSTYCLEELPVQDFELPAGFKKTENQFLIFGICKNCYHEQE